MWKESLCIGVEAIDRQHKELFDKTGELLLKLNDSAQDHRDECISMVAFLKHYVVKHFAEEEAYQRSIGCQGYAAHKKNHEEFINTVLEYETRMIASDFDSKDIREFAGTLRAI